MRNRHSFSRFVITVVCLLFPVAIVVLTLSRYRNLASMSNNFFSTSVVLEPKPVQLLSTRSSQIIYLNKMGYRVALQSDAAVDYIEDKNTNNVIQEYVHTATTSLSTLSPNMTDVQLNNYDVKHEENEAERDETIDYNFSLQEITNELRFPPRRPVCNYNQPTTNLIQLKTHRTGSSTLASILYRYGDLNNLDFALPKEKNYEYYWPVKFSPSFVDKQHVKSSRSHMLVNARFEKSAMMTFMGKEAFVITVLRDPVSHFESSFYANRLDRLFGLENSSNPLQEFLSNPKQYMTDYLQREKKIDIHLNHAVNGQIFDLGLKRIHFSDQHVINHTIEELDESIDFVLIGDYMDESLVLLKRALCWDLDDILYFTQRRRSSDYKELNITAKMKEQIRHWNLADVSLHKHFNESLWRKIEEQDSSFFDEVRNVKIKRENLEKECIQSTDVDMETGEIRIKVKQDSLTINRYFCDKMNMNEDSYIAYLKDKARLKFQEEFKYITNHFQELENRAFGNLSSI